MLVSSFVALALALSALSHPLAVRQQEEEPVVTTIWGSVDCNVNNPPGSDPMPCPPIPTSTVITLSETAVPTSTDSETTLAPVSSATTSSDPQVTTIWGVYDCNRDNKPGDPMKPCPPFLTSTVVTLTDTMSEPSSSTTVLPDPTTTDVPPEVTTVWGSVDCNVNNKPGDPMKPCPPMPTSTVITLTPTPSSESAAATSTTTDVPPEVTTVWGSVDCNANNGPNDPMKPCPPMPTSTVITLTPTPTPTSTATATTSDVPPEVTTVWVRTDCNANNGPRDPMKPCPPFYTSTVITLSQSQSATEDPAPTPGVDWRH